MNRHRYIAAALVLFAWAFPLRHARAATVSVGPTRATTRPDAATVKAAGVNGTILLDPGTYTLSAALDLNQTGLTLALADGSPTGSATIEYAGAHDYSEALKISASTVTVRDVAVRGINCRDVNVGHVLNPRLINVHSVGDLYGFDFDSVDGLLLDGCTATRKAAYVYYVHGNQSAHTSSGTVTVTSCQGGGSAGQHNFRVNSTAKITFSKCAFAFTPDSPNGKLAPGISIRAGVGEAVIDDCDTYGLGLGPEIGPGADAPGSTVGKVTVTNTRVHGGWVALWGGLQQAFLSDLTVNADRSGSAIGIGDGIAGELARLTLTYPNGQPFNRAMTAFPAGLKLTGPITHNGKTIVAAAGPVTPPTPAQQADGYVATIQSKLTDPAALAALASLRALIH
jgi:hypothetical protein